MSIVAGGMLALASACQMDRAPSGEGGAGAGSGGHAGGNGAGHGGSGGGGKGGRDATGGAGSGGSSSGGGTTGSGSNTLADFATVHDIVFTLCGGSGCHEPGNTAPTLLVDDAKLYSTLLSYKSSYCGNRVLVKPGSPQDSAFYLAQAGLCGDSLPQMPLGCVDNCTPPDYLDGVRQWIEDGAPQ